jgi:hypothetical protein
MLMTGRWIPGYVRARSKLFQKLFEKKIYLDLTGGSQTTPLQKSFILGVGEGLRPSRKQVEQVMLTSQIASQDISHARSITRVVQVRLTKHTEIESIPRWLETVAIAICTQYCQLYISRLF